MSTSPNLRLPYLDANQNQKSVTHNAALRMLDALVNLRVASAALTAPPAAPADGQRWIVASGATGAWLGKDLAVAAWQDGAWAFYAPNPGATAYVDALGGALLWNGAAWVPPFGPATRLTLGALGIGAGADDANPLSARLNAALFSALPTGSSPAGTGDVRLKLSKQAPANTASLLFQDGYSGRAEIGLTGDDDLHVRVSRDGSSFIDAMVVAASGGGVSFPVSPTAPTPAPGDASARLATTAFVAAVAASTPGATGPRGPAGPTGLQGAAGPTGAAGTAGPAGPTGPQGPAGAASTTMGPAGPVGPTGAAGPAGIAGATGPQGQAGAAGATGAVGPQGGTGVAGAAGSAGATGAMGQQGATGAAGATGPAGQQGAAGTAGAAGAIGPAGQQGTTGAVGAAGAAGQQGASGPTGATGPAGPQGGTGIAGATGAAGATGLAGQQGASGPTGATGPAGPQGGTGIAGATGTTGATGPAGQQGAGGAAGAAGATGPAGPQGAAGPTGAPGATGQQGATGAAGFARTQVNDASYAVAATDRSVAMIALTAARTLSLPAAAAYPAGAVLTAFDESGACSATSPITLAAAGSDLINGAASAVIAAPYGYLALESNTANKWTIVDAPAPVASVAGRSGAVALAVADVAGAAPLASPALTGAPTAPNAAAGTNSAQLATTSFVAASFVTYAYASANYATAANATLTGTPTAPTAAQNDNSTRLATTAYADRAARAGVGRTQVNDAAYAILASDRSVAVIALSAARTLTLPSASAYPAGTTLAVFDESGACSATATITVAASGGDAINGASSGVIATAYGHLALQSNTSNRWTVVDAPATPPSGGSGAPSAYTSQALPYALAAADRGKAVNPTGTGTMSLPAATAVAGWFAYLRKRDDGGVATLAPASGTVDGLAGILLYKEECTVYYDAAASAAAGAPVYRTQGRQRGWIDLGAFTVPSGAASVTIAVNDPEVRDVEIDACNYVPSAAGVLGLAVLQSGTAGSIYGEYVSAQSTSSGGGAAGGTLVPLTATTANPVHLRALVRNVQATTAYTVTVAATASTSNQQRTSDAVLSSAGAVSSLTLTPSTGTINSMTYVVRVFRP